MKLTFLESVFAAITGTFITFVFILVCSSIPQLADFTKSVPVIIITGVLFIATMILCLRNRSISALLILTDIIAVFFIAVGLISYVLTQLFKLVGIPDFIWIGYVIILIMFIVWLISFIRNPKLIKWATTNEVYILQGLITGLVTACDIPGRLGKFIILINGLYKSITRIPLDVQILPLDKVVVTTVDGQPVDVVGTFHFKIVDPMLYYNKIGVLGDNFESDLSRVGNYFSRILETHIEFIVSNGCQPNGSNSNPGDNGYRLEDMDQNKKRIAQESISDLCKDPNNDEFRSCGLRVVDLFITDFGGEDIKKRREYEGKIQIQQNEFALSNETTKTAVQVQKNQLAIQQAMLKTNKAKVATEKVLQVGKASIQVEAIRKMFILIDEHKKAFASMNPQETIRKIAEFLSKHNPELRTSINGGSGDNSIFTALATKTFELMDSGKFNFENMLNSLGFETKEQQKSLEVQQQQ